MTSKSQLSLFPEGGDQCWSPLHGLEPIAGELTDFADGVEAQIGNLMLLEIGPDFQFVSMYGATKKTSDDVCVGSDFNKVIENKSIPLV